MSGLTVPVITRHNPFHELLKERNGKGRITVRGTPNHSFLNKVAADGPKRLNRAV
ncbi:MAG: hypothetical protein G3I11_02185 [Ferrovum sp.]|nr:hypothetical protein [Ferrovum sp.]